MLTVCWIRLGFSRGEGVVVVRLNGGQGGFVHLCGLGLGMICGSIGVLECWWALFFFAFDGGLRGEESGVDTEE